MTEEERNNLLAEARQAAVAAPVIIPMLDAMKSQTIQKLISSYREGKHRYVGLVAELSNIDRMQYEFNKKLEYANLTEQKRG